TDRDSNKEKMVVSSEDNNGQGSCGAVFARVEGVKDGAKVSICVSPKNAISNGNDNEDGIRDLETVEHDKVVLDQDDEANDYQDCYNVQQNEVGQDQTQEHVQKDDMGRNEDQENMQKDVEKSGMLQTLCSIKARMSRGMNDARLMHLLGYRNL
ncbi:hypothetical protein Tco_1277770, partial [Tanacetum coccineum]